MAQRIWTTHTPAAQPVCAHADTAYAAAGETRSRTRPTSYELFRSTPITYPYHDVGGRLPTPRAKHQSRHARNRGWMLLLAYSFILSRSMFEGHLLNFRGYVLGFSNKPFDKWQRTNPPTTKRPPFSLAYAFFPCNLILNKHAPNTIKYMRSFFCSTIRNVSFLL